MRNVFIIIIIIFTLLHKTILQYVEKGVINIAIVNINIIGIINM